MARNLYALGLGMSALVVMTASLVDAGDSNPSHYTVDAVDTWQTIAASHGITADDLQVANNLAASTSNTAHPRTGWVLHIPEVPPSPTTTTAAPTTSTTTTAPPATTTTTTILAPSTTTTVAPDPTTTTTGPTTTTAPPSTTSTTQPPAPTTTLAPPSGLSFVETFETAAGFFNRFEYGYSGPNPNNWNGANPLLWPSDHSSSCQAPGAGTDRTIHIHDDGTHTGSVGDFNELFYHCAPGDDPAKGHLMTTINTIAYNIAWFSPLQTFNHVSKVCVDVNMTELGTRKWWQILFLTPSEATRYETGESAPESLTDSRSGTGGFDLGYTSPDNEGQTGPSTASAGIKFENGLVGVWAGNNLSGRSGTRVNGLQDEATRYKQCFTDLENGTVRVDSARPGGTVTFTAPGAIPNDARRVVFEDDSYDGEKGDNASVAHLTLHWDNVEIYTS
jgi:LysM repeat protein